MAEKRCNSCKQATANDKSAASFPCPQCQELITRCGHCRKTATLYKCSNCGFEGP